jgi:transposase
VKALVRHSLERERLGGITKQGDRYVRQMLGVAAMAVIRYAKRHGRR